MAYNSYLYLVVFLGLSLLFFYVMPKKLRWLILLLASLIFYYISSHMLIVYILISSVSVYLAAIWLDRIIKSYEITKPTLPKEERKAYTDRVTRRKKLVVLLAILVNFGILISLKYSNFFVENANPLLHSIKLHQLPLRKVILPLGISYYTLMAASYVIDVYRGKCKADYNPAHVLLYLCFFPQIVEGPIGRYDHLTPQLFGGLAFNNKSFTFGAQLIIWGLFKKVVIADRANILVKTVFGNTQQYTGIYALLGMLFFTLQIYAEFSGAIDIVTGSAQMFGVDLARNFERPFFSKSIAEFWRRWHITLGAWLRDYILYTISLSKWFMKLNKSIKKHISSNFGKTIPTAIPMLFVWLACGLWHGASWKYVLYGIYYYALMLLGMLFEPLFAKLFSSLKINRESKAYRAWQLLRTIILVNIGMLIFRAPQLNTAWSMLASIFTGFKPSVIVDGSLLKLGMDMQDYAVIIFGSLIMLIVGILQEKGYSLREKIAERGIALRWCVYFAAIFAVIIFGAYGAGYNPVDFIYAQF